jgi:acetamidase/formamidase
VLADVCEYWITAFCCVACFVRKVLFVLCGAGDGVHIMTGPIYVCGAGPGDILQVDILDLQPRKNPATGKVQPALL